MKTVKHIRGHSLVEMLTVISVIGVMAAIAVPTISRINDSSEEARNKRNAQSLTSVYSSAAAAGLDFMDEGGNLTATIGNISNGGFVSGGPYDGSWFGVPLSEDQQAAAANYLGVQNGGLQYFPTGVIQALPGGEVFEPPEVIHAVEVSEGMIMSDPN